MQSLIRICHALMGDMAAVKVLKNALCFINGVFDCHVNTSYVILIGT